MDIIIKKNEETILTVDASDLDGKAPEDIARMSESWDIVKSEYIFRDGMNFIDGIDPDEFVEDDLVSIIYHVKEK